MPVVAEPARLVECAGADAAQPGPQFGGVGDRGAADRAELDPQRAAALVGAVLVGRETAADLDVLLAEVAHRRERAAGARLAEAAVAHGADERRRLHLVA